MTIRENVQSGICWIIDNREDGMPSKFASRIGVDRQKVNHWKNGRNAPDLEKLGEIARIYKVSLDWLIGGDESKAPKDYR